MKQKAEDVAKAKVAKLQAALDVASSCSGPVGGRQKQRVTHIVGDRLGAPRNTWSTKMWCLRDTTHFGIVFSKGPRAKRCSVIARSVACHEVSGNRAMSRLATRRLPAKSRTKRPHLEKTKNVRGGPRGRHREPQSEEV